ncbi:ATP-binding protein [Entomobacter blattae]|uniref:Helicase HerA, central domain n=1 Tax=Entomobacter blattae TaxID=2762277 RepID=A0A7H1NUT6_9PROT|nr:ATP-binding protein [Entomobacter blattae]QNT79546.1 Helicase HerA, central domain [Entomobacter blattae]
MTSDIELGTRLEQGRTVPVSVDLVELLATRLLVQGNSGSGKSHLLRRLLEQSASHVQQIIIDPEGDFSTLAGKYNHLALDAADYTLAQLYQAAERVRQHRVSAILNMENVEIDGQLRSAAAFLSGLFDAPRSYWFPVLVVVDEAQLFAPAGGGDYSEEARRASLSAMTNLMCRGRKRGLAGVIATQRLAKLAKNVAAEASNFLMGRTFLDIDMLRASDLLGMERRQAEAFRDLERGHFIALGPAISRKPLPVKIGAVETASRSGEVQVMQFTPLPSIEQAENLVLMDLQATELPQRVEKRPVSVAESTALLDAYIQQAERMEQDSGLCEPTMNADERLEKALEIVYAVLAERVGRDSLPLAEIYQAFSQKWRVAGLGKQGLSIAELRGLVVLANTKTDSAFLQDSDWLTAQSMAKELPDDIQGVFLLIACTAIRKQPAPTEKQVAYIYGTASLARARRQIEYLEEKNFIVICYEEQGRKEKIAIPGTNWETALLAKG